ncbi:MAG: hypothetical protein ABF959_08840 [Gluconobacter albidus]
MHDNISARSDPSPLHPNFRNRLDAVIDGALAADRLVGQGRISLDNLVETVLQEFRPPLADGRSTSIER